MSRQRVIPVCEPLYLGNEEKYIRDAVRSRWISSAGGYIKRFESQFSEYCGMRYGITTTNGTAALHLALRAIGIGEKDEVIIPDFTMIAVMYAVLYCGAKPVLIDAEADTWNMDVRKIARKISRRTKAIIAVHTYGHPVDMAPLLKLAKRYGLYIIEDAAEAHGAEYRGKKCGSLGHINCFSFYANKIITTGEGGMVVTSDPDLAEKCRYYKNQCFPLSNIRDYRHDDLGYNYRMTNMQAALGLAQLENIDKFVKRRRDNAGLYSKRLKDISGIRPAVEKEYAKNVYWMYGIVINPKEFGKTRDEVIQILEKENIETRPFFKPMHTQKVLNKLGVKRRGDYPVSEEISKNGFYLPSGSGLTKYEIEYICAVIRKVQKRK